MRSRALLAGIAALAGGCGRFDFSPGTRGDGGSNGDGPSGGGDADPDAAPTVACIAGRLLCDTFDTQLIDGAPWTVVGDVTRDTTVAHRGASSLRMHIPATAQATEVGSYIGYTGSAISTATTLWTRAWFRIGALPTSTNALEIIAIQQSGSQGDYVFLRAADTQLYHQFDGLSGSAGAAPPANTWFCLVWQLDLATTSTGSSFVTSDILPAFSITSSVTQGSPPADAIGIGPYYATGNLDVATAAFDMWVDDVIVDDVALTCSD